MDWLKQLPIGQYVDGDSGWLRRVDARLKLAWTLAFLITPILAGPVWRLALVGALLLITALCGLPWRLWRRNLPFLLALCLLVGSLSALLPAGAAGSSAQLSRDPAELRLVPRPPANRRPNAAANPGKCCVGGPCSWGRCRSARW